jgi:hypothetical protein
MKFTHVNELKPEDIKTTESSIIFFVSSAIYPFCQTHFTPAERLKQTVETMESIRRFVPDAVIIMTEASPLQEDDLKTLSPYVDNLVSFANHDMKSLGKNSGEKYMSFFLSNVLQNCVFRKMYKLSGRYFLLDGFQDSDFSDEKITLRRATWKPERLCMITVMYCVPWCQRIAYCSSLQKALAIANDIEHALFQSLPPGSYTEIPVVNAGGHFVRGELFKC